MPKKYYRRLHRVSIMVWEDQFEQFRHMKDYNAWIRNGIERMLAERETDPIIIEALTQVYEKYQPMIINGEDQVLKLQYYAKLTGLLPGIRDCQTVCENKQRERNALGEENQ